MSADDARGPGKRPGWWPWVRDEMIERWGKASPTRLAREGDFNRTNVYRWQEGGDVEPWLVQVVADALGANPIHAFIAADYFTAEQFDEYRQAAGPERELSDEALAREVLARMRQGRSGNGGLSEHEPAPHLAGPNKPTGRRRPVRDGNGTAADEPEGLSAD